MDGEGCISAATNPTRGFVIVKITNTHRPLLEWFMSLFGGRIQLKTCHATPATWKPSWDWYCATEHVIPLMHLLVPFLKQKQPQAYLVMAIRHSQIEGKDKKGIDKLIAKIQGMNKRGR